VRKVCASAVVSIINTRDPWTKAGPSCRTASDQQFELQQCQRLTVRDPTQLNHWQPTCRHFLLWENSYTFCDTIFCPARRHVWFISAGLCLFNMLSIDTTSSPSASDADNRVKGGLTSCLGEGRGKRGLTVRTSDTVARQPAAHVLHLLLPEGCYTAVITQKVLAIFFSNDFWFFWTK